MYPLVLEYNFGLYYFIVFCIRLGRGFGFHRVSDIGHFPSKSGVWCVLCVRWGIEHLTLLRRLMLQHSVVSLIRI